MDCPVRKLWPSLAGNKQVRLSFSSLSVGAEPEPLPLPAYETEAAAGLDLRAAVRSAIDLAPGKRVLIPTGFAMEIPAGFEGQVRPRSGRALREGLSLVNSPGTIDSDYRGEVGVIAINLGSEVIRIERGDRIAQLVVAPVTQMVVTECNELSSTVRLGGFGTLDIIPTCCVKQF